MEGRASEADATIWTVGHSNHPWAEFLELLQRHQIAALADVRSSPYSSYATHFNREVLRPALESRNIEYRFLGDSLGGRAQGEQFYDEAGHVLYGRLAQSSHFLEGIDRLLEGNTVRRIAIMCGEEDPTECHRRLLIGRVLSDRGIRVLHIRGDGRTETEQEIATEDKFRKTKGQMTLFDMEGPDEWKSTQSVLPKRAPRSSSGSSNGPASDDSSTYG